MLGGAGSPGGEEILTVTIVRDALGYGMKVSGDKPVYVQSVKEHGAAWRAGLRAGDRILRVDGEPVHHHTHQQVVHMIRAHATTVLTVHQSTQRLKTPITAPVPVNSEKQRQLEFAKVHTVRMMLEKEQKFIRDLRNELSKVPDVRKQTQLESAEQRCAKLQQEIDTIVTTQPMDLSSSHPHLAAPATPKLGSRKSSEKLGTSSPPPNNSTGFLSNLPRSLSNLTGQSLTKLRQARQSRTQQENQPPLVRQNSDESNNKRRHGHNNTVPMVPTTCLDNVTPPPLPPRSTERPKRHPLSPTFSPPLNPLAVKPKAGSSVSPMHKQYYPNKFGSPMHQSMPGPEYREDNAHKFRRSSHSLDGELDVPQPNSIALQMSYPLVNAPPPPLQMDNRTGVPVLHVRSQSSPEHLDHGLRKPEEKEVWERSNPPPGTPPPPYAHNTQPCADPQRAIISMEEDDDPASDNSTYSGLFSNLRSVRESKAKTAVLLNWLIGERRCACANLLLLITDGYRAATGVSIPTLRRWAYEIQSTFLMPNAVLQLNGVDENMANEIEHVLANDYEKEELLRNVFRKARQKAKEELAQQLSEFCVKRQVGLATLYGPEDAVLEQCQADKAQEQLVVERVMSSCLAAGGGGGGGGGPPCAPHDSRPPRDAHCALTGALVAAAQLLHCRPATVAAAVGGSKPSFLQRDKLYKQRVKQLTKQHPQPYVVRGHHLYLQALTSVAHCHLCDHVIGLFAPQAYVCNDCNLRVHRECAKAVEEPCCLDGEHHNNRISRFMERIHPNQTNQDIGKSRKTSGAAHFLNMERSFRRVEDEPAWETAAAAAAPQGEPKREGSSEEPLANDADADVNDAKEPEKETSWRPTPSSGGRGVNRAESCRERDVPRRGKHRNASDPNRLTAHNNHDLEPGAATAPSGSSSSSSLSSRSNESNTIATESQEYFEDGEVEEPLPAQWAKSLPPQVLDSLLLSSRLRKRQEVIHELIVSEISHVRWLRVLGDLFLKPLESWPTLLPAEELRALFPNLPGVRERHSKLCTELKQARNEATNHVLHIRPVADAMLNTLGDSGYANCLSRFCRGQRMALEALRERRRKNKELHQLLSSKEQSPQCGRLQLRDLLACVWQRLTKYQLLLESILQTVADEDSETEEDVARLKQALDVAKDVLHSVDTAIRTAENEHRLKTIQNKLEVRASGNEWEELRRLDLTQRKLRMEGQLTIRNDTNKKINVLALMFEDVLILLQQEGDKFILKPFTQRSQQELLSPMIRWDKVLFRANAAVRNTFFLMNINGIQMHELSANTNAEYSTWVKYIQEVPLAKPSDLKSGGVHPPRAVSDDSGTNVSRNPSDASEKSSSTVPIEENSEERASIERDDKRVDKDDRRSVETERRSVEGERRSVDGEGASIEGDRRSVEGARRSMDGDRRSVDKDCDEEERHKPRRPTVGRISTHGRELTAPLESSAAIVVSEPAAQRACVAAQMCTQQERLRRLDEVIAKSLKSKSAIVGELLGVPQDSLADVADLAIADTLGQVDICRELRATRLERSVSVDEPTDSPQADMHQLLLAAHAQANQLTEIVAGALSVNETAIVASRSRRRGHCDNCRDRRKRTSTLEEGDEAPPLEDPSPAPAPAAGAAPSAPSASPLHASLDQSFDMLNDLSAQGDLANCSTDGLVCEADTSGAALAARLAPLTSGLQRALGSLLATVPRALAAQAQLRAEAAALRDCADRRRHENQINEEISPANDGLDQTIQDQPPSNGG